MVNQYNPDSAPDAGEWLALDEQERIHLVELYHDHARVKLPNLTAHAVFHAIVENQIAEGWDPVSRAMARLAGEGLTRHDAVHAVAFVVATHINDLFKSKDDAITSMARYSAAIERLNAKSWHELR